MPGSQKGKLLKIYVNEAEKWRHTSLYHAVILELNKLGIRGATVYRGIEGFGSDHKIHTARILDTTFDLPIVIEAVDSEEKIKEAVDLIKPMVKRGFILIADVEFIDIH